MGFGTDFPAAKVDIAGTVKITNGTEGVGKVLTSDVVGNAAWQDLITLDVHLSACSFAGFTVPSATEQTLINWSNLDEAGGANWNATTGEYTITVAGYYSVFCHLRWGTATSNGILIGASIDVNNSIIARGFSNKAVTNENPSDSHVQLEQRFAVGDKIKFKAFQTTSGSMFVVGSAASCKFGIHLIHK